MSNPITTFKKYEDFIVEVGNINKEKDILIFLPGLIEELGELYENLLSDIEFDIEDDSQLHLLDELNSVHTSGIILSMLKRLFRGDHFTNNSRVKSIGTNTKIKDKNIKEFGDILAYLVLLAKSVDISLEEIVAANVAKLNSRRDRGQLKGSGDDR